ncbi:MAG: 7-carboxy-7-deazaguanine synthase QueE [Planctomycetia bacterium]|nr:7-carboxy-7-deazaguanine synthase QueE [Planctomycetia bacterium]
MRIAEIFYSVQGEGMLTGMPSVFVRTSGCNLRCSFCDTPYTSWKPEGDTLSLEQVVEKVLSYTCRHVVITGGEPFIAPDLESLCLAVSQAGKHITLETAATVYKPVKADLLSLSPKLSNSSPEAETGWAERHERDRMNLPVIRQFVEEYPVQFKWVIDQPTDIDEVRSIMAQLPAVDSDRVFLMPQAITQEDFVEKGRWIAELCKQYGYRFGSRLHIELWGHTRGT